MRFNEEVQPCRKLVNQYLMLLNMASLVVVVKLFISKIYHPSMH